MTPDSTVPSDTKTCAKCGRTGTRSFVADGDTWVCTAKWSCQGRAAEANAKKREAGFKETAEDLNVPANVQGNLKPAPVPSDTDRLAACSIEDCPKPKKAKGMCGMHYARLRTHGDPHHKVTTEDRFWSHVNKTGACWEWTANIARAGYGTFSVNRKTTSAHRYAFELANGPIPVGKIVCHHCDNRKCVRPGHLYAGTYRDNILDVMERNPGQRERVAQMPRLHGTKHWCAKLTDEQVLEIRASRGEMSNRAAAAKYGMSQSTIGAIRNNKVWRHLL